MERSAGPWPSGKRVRFTVERLERGRIVDLRASQAIGDDAVQIEGSASARRLRAEERRKRAVVHFVSLGKAEPDFQIVRGSEAISLVTRLTRESWSLSGRNLYPRSATPYCFVPNRRQ